MTEGIKLGGKQAEESVPTKAHSPLEPEMEPRILEFHHSTVVSRYICNPRQSALTPSVIVGLQSTIALCCTISSSDRGLCGGYKDSNPADGPCECQYDAK